MITNCLLFLHRKDADGCALVPPLYCELLEAQLVQKATRRNSGENVSFIQRAVFD